MKPPSLVPIGLAAALVCLLSPAARAQQDNSPPAVQSVSLGPPSVNVQYSSQTITVTLRITDDISGFAGGVLGLANPTGQVAYGSNYFYPTGNSALDGEYQVQIQIPR